MAKRLAKVRLSIGTTTPPPSPPGSDVFEVVGNVFSTSGITINKPDIDHSDFDSTSREFFAGLKDNGEFSGQLRRNYGNAGQTAMRNAANAAGGTQYAFKVEFLGPSGTPDETWVFVGEVKQWDVSAELDNPLNVTFSIKVSGDVTVS